MIFIWLAIVIGLILLLSIILTLNILLGHIYDPVIMP